LYLECPNCQRVNDFMTLLRCHVDNCEYVFCYDCYHNHILYQHYNKTELTKQESKEFQYNPSDSDSKESKK